MLSRTCLVQRTMFGHASVGSGSSANSVIVRTPQSIRMRAFWFANLAATMQILEVQKLVCPLPIPPHLHRFQQAFVPAVRELDDEPLSNRNHSSKGSVLLRKLRIGMGQKDQAKKMDC